jgi:hypothetical protein
MNWLRKLGQIFDLADHRAQLTLLALICSHYRGRIERLEAAVLTLAGDQAAMKAEVEVRESDTELASRVEELSSELHALKKKLGIASMETQLR